MTAPDVPGSTRAVPALTPGAPDTVRRALADAESALVASEPPASR